MLESGLQQEINFVMAQARNNRLKFVTVEHLLLAILNIDKVVTFLRKNRVKIDEMRDELEEYIDSHTSLIPLDSEVDIIPTVGFQRVLERSVYQAQSAKKTSVYAMDVLVNIFSDKESHAVYLLKRNNIFRLDILDEIFKPTSKSVEQAPEIAKKLPTVDNIIFDKNGKACLPRFLLQRVMPYTGNYEKKYKNNLIEIAGQYSDGVKVGLWTEYYENGNYKFLVKFINGEKDGVAIYWDENGRKTKEESYKNDRLDGATVSFTWYKNGRSIYPTGNG